MKARYQYRIYPTPQQQQSLAQLFGCVRVAFNDGLGFSKQSGQYPGVKVLSARLTEAKKTMERAWLGDVSSVPLQQALQDLDVAYRNFFKSVKGDRKGLRVNPPRFKKKTNRQSARFTKAAFKLKGSKVYQKLATRLVRENSVVVLEDLNVSGMVKNRCLARAISRAGWRHIRTLCEAKANMINEREVRVISRWQPTSGTCSCCGYRWSKLDLSILSTRQETM